MAALLHRICSNAKFDDRHGHEPHRICAQRHLTEAGERAAGADRSIALSRRPSAFRANDAGDGHGRRSGERRPHGLNVTGVRTTVQTRSRRRPRTGPPATLESGSRRLDDGQPGAAALLGRGDRDALPSLVGVRRARARLSLTSERSVTTGTMRATPAIVASRTTPSILSPLSTACTRTVDTAGSGAERIGSPIATAAPLAIRPNHARAGTRGPCRRRRRSRRRRRGASRAPGDATRLREASSRPAKGSRPGT